MQVMRTLYVTDHAARLRIRKGNLVVERSRESTRVPLETLDAVVLLGRAEISNDTLGELARRRVGVSALSKTGKLRFWVGSSTQGNVMLRLGQYEAACDDERSLAIARLLVAGKLQNCRRMMKRWVWDASGRAQRAVIQSEIDAVAQRIGALHAAGDGDTVRGLEGDGSRRYFKALAIHLQEHESKLSFPSRTRRPPRDPVNALLSFTYGLVLTEVIGALESVGLDPQIGYLHRARPGRPSLALDLLEEFRPSVADRFVASAFRRSQVTDEDFVVTAGRAVYLSDDGRRRVLEAYEANRQRLVPHPLLGRPVPVALLPSLQATLLARHLRGDLAAYPPYTMAA
jgi:CRISP-associated protein Cas1